MALPVKKPPIGDILESVIIQGDLSALTPEQRVEYYNKVCDTVGLNPFTQPFQYLKLQGKLILYANRSAADQLRKMHGIDIEIISQDVADGLMTVHARAKDKDGRVDEDLGVVPFPDTLRGEPRANQILKCVTKAKRRVTLSISGLGWLDETEVETIPGAEKVPPKPAPNVLLHDPDTGEVTPEELREARADLYHGPKSAPANVAVAGADAAPDADPRPSDDVSAGAAPDLGPPDFIHYRTGAPSIEDMARQAAMRGKDMIERFYRNRTPSERKRIATIKKELDQLVDEAEAAKEEC